MVNFAAQNETEVVTSDGYEAIKSQIKLEFEKRKEGYRHNETHGISVEQSDLLNDSSLPILLQKLAEEAENNPSLMELLVELEEYCIDDGLAKSFDLAINVNGETKKYSTRGIHCLNRNGLVGKTLENASTYEEARAANLTIIKIDLEKFRNTDNVEVVDSEGNRMPAGRYIGDPLKDPRGSEKLADYVLIDLASKAQPMVDSINAVLRSRGEQGEVVFGRIGGDEFGIIFKRIYDQELIKLLYGMIISEEYGIQSVETYYRSEETEEVVAGKVRVKHEDVEWVQFNGEDERVERFIFEQLKETGNIFRYVDAYKEIDNPNSGISLPDRLKEYHRSLKSMFNKANPALVNNILEVSPHLRDIFDRSESVKTVSDPRNAIAEFCLDYIFDRLTCTNVTNIRIFLKRSIEGVANQTEFTRTGNSELIDRVRYRNPVFMVFDLQGPKGINTLVSYLATDMAVQSMILDQCLAAKEFLTGTKKENVEVIIGRNGTKAVVMIAEKVKGKLGGKTNLVSELSSQLYNKRHAEVIQDGHVCKVPIAKARDQRTPDNGVQGRKLLRHLIDKANEDWRKEVLIMFITPFINNKHAEDLFKLRTKFFTPDYIEPHKGITLYEYLQSDVFIPDTFRRVRVSERVRALLEAGESVLRTLQAPRVREPYDNLTGRKITDFVEGLRDLLGKEKAKAA